jgi:hypothetical protein
VVAQPLAPRSYLRALLAEHPLQRRAVCVVAAPACTADLRPNIWQVFWLLDRLLRLDSDLDD